MNFINLFNIVSKYYPIGLEVNSSHFHLYSGSEHLKSIMEDKLTNNLHIEKWKYLAELLEQKFIDKEVIVKYSITDTCYSMSTVISRRNINNIDHSVTLYWHLSFLGDYYSIYAKEIIKIQSNGVEKEFDPLIFVSPDENLDIYWDAIRSTMMELYPESKLIPYVLLRCRVNSLKIPTSKLKEHQYSSIFQCFFHRENLTDYKIVGDVFYE